MYREKKRKRASNIRQRDFKGFARPFRVVRIITRYSKGRKKKHFTRQQRYARRGMDGEKREKTETRSTQACPCVTMHIMPVGVSTLTHASMQISRNDIQNHPPETRLYVDDVTVDAHARISVRVDRYPPSAARLLKVRSHARCRRGSLGDYDIWNNAVAQIGVRERGQCGQFRARGRDATELIHD